MSFLAYSSCNMVKFKWPIDKVHVQRLILLSIAGMISFGIIKGHLEYEKEVTMKHRGRIVTQSPVHLYRMTNR